MSGIQAFISDLASQLFADRSVFSVLSLLSPVKLWAICYGTYKALSPRWVEPMTLNVDETNLSDPGTSTSLKER